MSAYTGTDNLEVMAEAVNYNRFLLSLIRAFARKEQNILDFGAGIGTFAKALAAEGYRVHCLEPDVNQAVVISAAGLKVAGAADEIASESIDYIYSLNVLEHIDDDVAALRDCYRMLKSGGSLLIYVPAFQLLYSSMDRKVGHCRRYTKRELVAKARYAGFEIRRSYYADSLGFAASLLYRWLGSDTGDMNRKALVFYDRYAFPVSRMLDILCGFLFGKNVVLEATKR